MIADYLWPDWLTALVVPIVLVEVVRASRMEVQLGRRTLREALSIALFEGLLMLICLSARTPLVFMVVAGLHFGAASYRERGLWGRGVVKILCILAAIGLVGFGAGVASIDAIEGASIDPTIRGAAIALLSGATVLSLLPVSVREESKSAHVTPIALVAFARFAVPLAAAEPRATLLLPHVAGALSMLSALWLLTAGMRAAHFERSSLVSELLVCERGVLFSFVWMGLASGDHLAGVGAVLEWWAGALALVALEGALRVKVLPKPMAFFALAMAVGLPGTVGFVAEDLLAHGMLELRPWLAAGFVAVSAINAAALYLSIVNVIAESGYDARVSPPPSRTMVALALMSLVTGLAPRPFVSTAVLARDAMGGVSAPAEAHE